MHELYAVPGVVNPPVLHHLLALSRFLVWLLQCDALLEQKGPEFDVKLAGYYSMARDLKKSEFENPNFLGPRGKKILAALSEGLVWVHCGTRKLTFFQWGMVRHGYSMDYSTKACNRPSWPVAIL